MGLKIKWNDDRLRGTTTALLLISRDHLSRRGFTEDLIQTAIAEYRADPSGYKANKATWPDVSEVGPLTNPLHVAYYRKLLSTVDKLVGKMVLAKRQFNSLTELDNFLIFTLKSVR